jgi:asparagine synthase (glutamine-hydrolysing)
VNPFVADLRPRGTVTATPWLPKPRRTSPIAGDGDLVVAFDGRLDNRRGLARELEVEGSDADIALASWRRWQSRAVERWEGPFAVVVFEPASGRAWLARDEIGVRGLAYGRTRDGWAVATVEHEVARAIGAEIDAVRVAAFLALRDAEPWRSFFVGVRAVLPGELVALAPGEAPNPRRFARPLGSAPIVGGLDEAAERFRRHVDRAVDATCEAAAGPVALLFSGGLDSTTLAASMVARGTPPASLITWNFDSFPDERREQRAVAEALGLPLRSLLLDHAVPLADESPWPVHPSTPEQTPFRRLHQAAFAAATECGARTLLWGYGGDMFFLGGEALPRALARRGRWAAALAAARGSVAERGMRATLRENTPPAWLRRWQRRRPPQGFTDEGAALLERTGSVGFPDEDQALFPRRALRLTAFSSVQGDANENWFSSPLDVAIEAPLRDRELVRWILEGAPWTSLTADRALQRRALSGRVPEAVARRPGKGSFEPLLRRLLTDPTARRRAHDTLFAPDASWRRYWKPGGLEAVWNGEDPSARGLQHLWSALSLELWTRRT